MKKRWLGIAGIMVLLIGIVGLWGYNEFFRPDTEVQQQLNEQFGDDFFTFEDVDLEVSEPLETAVQVEETVPASSENEPTGDSTPISDSKMPGQEDNKQDKGTKPSTEPVSKEGVAPVKEDKVSTTVTADQINNKYQAQFAHLQDLAVSRLDTLFTAAVKEYKEGTLSRTQLAQKYIQAGTTLEANVDSQFYSVLAKMEKELKANNLATDLVSGYEDQYENAKSEKRAQLFAQVGR